MVTALDDIQLLRVYVAEDSQEAFRLLVERHVHLVYSIALRKTGTVAMAEEVAQAVFILLSKKAATFTSETILSGWLYRATCFAANDFLKSERRRQQREQEMYEHMQNTAPENAWTEIAPLLDEAMATLSDHDRHAIILRFFENKNLTDVGDALGISDDTAQKRISRALERLRTYFGRRKKLVTVTALAGLLSAYAVQAAPPEVIVSISDSVLGGAASLTTVALSAATAKRFSLLRLKLAFWSVFLMLTLGIAGWSFTLNFFAGELIEVTPPKNVSTFRPAAQKKPAPVNVSSLRPAESSTNNSTTAIVRSNKPLVLSTPSILPTKRLLPAPKTNGLVRANPIEPQGKVPPFKPKATAPSAATTAQRVVTIQSVVVQQTNVLPALPTDMPTRNVEPPRFRPVNIGPSSSGRSNGGIFGKGREANSRGQDLN